MDGQTATRPSGSWWRNPICQGALVLAAQVILFLLTPILRFDAAYYSTADLTQDYSLMNVVPGHQPENRLLSDPVLQMQPWLMFNRDELRHGRLPLWNPYNGAGVPHLANFQSAVFSPFSLPFYVLSFRLALLVSTFLQTFLLGFFTFLFLKALRCGQVAALVGATAFMFCGHNVLLAAYPHPAAAIALPAGLYFAERFLQILDALQSGPARGWLAAGAGSLVGLALSFTIGLLAGQPEPLFFAVLLVATWILYRLIGWLLSGPLDRARSMAALRAGATLLIAGVLPVGLTAFQILPFLEYLRESTILGIRSNPQSSLQLLNWPLFFFPDLLGNPSLPSNPDYTLPQPNYEAVNTSYLGGVALLLALVGLLFARRRGATWFFGAVALGWFAVTFELVSLKPVLTWSKLLALAPLNRSQPVGMFALSVCGALGLDALLRPADAASTIVRRWILSIAIFAGSMTMIVFAYRGARVLLRYVLGSRVPTPDYVKDYLPDHFAFVLGTFALGASALAAIALARTERSRAVLGLGVLAAVFLQSGWLLRNYNTTTPDELFFPRTDAVQKLGEKVGQATLVVLTEDTFPPDTNMVYGLSLLTNYDTLWIRRYDQLFRTLFPGAHTNWRNTLSCHEQGLRLFGVDFVLTLGPWIPMDTGLWEAIQPRGRLQALPVEPGKKLSQVFTPGRDGIRALALWLSTEPRADDSQIIVRLTRAATNELVFERRLRSDAVFPRLDQRRRTLFPTELVLPKPGGPAILRFPAEMHSANTTYRLTLRIPEAKSESVWTAWRQPELRQSDAALFLDGVHQPGTLLFDWSASIDTFEAIGPIGPYVLWRYTNGMGRYWIVHEAIAAQSEDDAFEKVLAGDFDPSRRVVLSQAQVANESETEAAPRERPEVLEETPSRVRLRATMSRPGWLVLARTWYPGWQATVDGAPAELVRANFAFQAVALPAGEHVVETRYVPTYFRLGLALSAASSAFGAACWWWLRRSRGAAA
jgi:membrane protein YfhO